MFVTDKKYPRSAAAAACAVLAGVSVWLFLRRVEETTAEAGTAVQVLTARSDIPRGALLQSALFRSVSIPKAYLEPDAIGGFDVLESSGHRHFRSLLSIPAGAQLVQRELTPIAQGDSLAQLIGENQAAVSFGVDVVRGLAGNIQPGDLIDVIHTTKGNEMDPNSRQTSLLFQALPVVAVGKRWTAYGSAREDKPTEKDEPLEKPEEDTAVITVLVNPVAAIRLAQARESETLSVILRARDDVQKLEVPQ